MHDFFLGTHAWQQPQQTFQELENHVEIRIESTTSIAMNSVLGVHVHVPEYSTIFSQSICSAATKPQPPTLPPKYFIFGGFDRPANFQHLLRPYWL
mmetsp:Transcript_8286/g.12327  ORF Transcript_8286/g.12327 Transcript_8286/m.12327 type:complete len:96 (+) Transcript_8286:43-330(+)